MQAQRIQLHRSTARPGLCRPRAVVQVPRRVVQASAASTASSQDTEAAALAAFTKAFINENQLMGVLQRAAQTKTMDPEIVEGALVKLEASTSASPEGIATVPGRWRLVFSTSTKTRAFQYIPVDEDLVIDLENKKISLESTVGPFEFFIRGTIFSWDPKTGELKFQFDKGVLCKLAGKDVFETTPKTSPKTYTFFYADSGISAARSSMGGLSLLLRNPPKTQLFW